jgi:hypothetical protein
VGNWDGFYWRRVFARKVIVLLLAVCAAAPFLTGYVSGFSAASVMWAVASIVVPKQALRMACLWNRQPADLPKAAWRALGAMRSLLLVGASLDVAIAVSIIGGGLSGLGLWPWRAAPIVVPLAIMPAVIGLTTLVNLHPWVELGRVSTCVQDVGGCMCLDCGYSLRGLPDVGTCPECGLPYEIDTVRETWRRAKW